MIFLLLCLPVPLTAASLAAVAAETVPAARTVPADDAVDRHRDVIRDPKADGRREAVRALAEIGTPEAWAVVVESLASTDPLVADEAQLALGELEDAGVLRDLWGRDGLTSNAGIVARRAAEALGRVPLVLGAGDLQRGLRAKDPIVRRLLMWTIERQGSEGRVVGAVDDLAAYLAGSVRKERDDGVAAAALLARCELEPAAREEAARAASENDASELRAAAAMAASPLPADVRIPLLESLRADSSRAVRWAVADALAADADRESAWLLVTMLENEEEQRNAWHLVSLLRDLSGMQHGLDPRPWTAWADALPEDWTPESGGDDGAAEEGDRTVALVGMPILSERVAFLIDFSGSTWKERDGGTRKEVLDVELRRALEALPEGTAFNLIPYTDDPHAWKDELVEASDRNVDRALDWFEGSKQSGKGNFWDAWLLAVSDPAVDTVMVLTDGAPTGGDRWNLELMAMLLEERNRFRRVALDALVVDAYGKLLEYWRDMCASTGGRMVSVGL